jgi:hypothetical protein
MIKKIVHLSDLKRQISELEDQLVDIDDMQLLVQPTNSFHPCNIVDIEINSNENALCLRIEDIY